MNAMAPTRPTELHEGRVRLTAGPAAAAEARRQVRAFIYARDVAADPGAAVLLVSELVTNAVRHEPGGTIMLAISCSYGQLRVDVHDTSCSLPVLVNASADAETGRGLMLVATLSAEWGFYRTPAGKAVFFTVAFEPGGAGRGERGSRGFMRGDGESCPPHGLPSPPNAQAIPGDASLWCDAAQGCLPGYIGPRMDVELLQDVGDVGRDGPAR